MKLKTAWIITLLLAAVPVVLGAEIRMDIPGGLRVVSTGNGSVSLFWFPPRGLWPEGGFQIQDQQGKVLVQQVLPLRDLERFPSLSKEDLAWLSRLADDRASLSDRRPAFDRQRLALALKSAISTEFAAALGLFHRLSDLPRGKRSYRVTGLDGRGHPTTMVMKSEAIDAFVVSGSPAAPSELEARASAGGIELYWKRRTGRENDIVYFDIERKSRSNDFVKILDQPLLVSKPLPADTGAELPQFIDASAPEEQDVTYRVVGVDFFGRRSQPAVVTVFVPTFSHLLPPAGVKIASTARGNVVSWDPGENRPSTRYMIERSPLAGGPFTMLTPRGIVHDDKGFLDKDLVAGGTYHYRLRTVAANGSLSPPSQTIQVGALQKDIPPAIQTLEARLGINSVVLTWAAGGPDVAGYVIERKVGSAWQRINDRVWPDNRFTYRYAAGQEIELRFRVRGVGVNNQLGPVGRELPVRIVKVPRGKPEITAVAQNERGIEIRFDFPQQRRDLRFVVRRGGSEFDEGLVVSPVLGHDEKAFTDAQVAPGERYWYRVQALGPQDWISELSDAVALSARAMPLPRPPAPKAGYMKEPFAHVRLACGPVPRDLAVIVERRSAAEPYWKTLAGEGGDGIYLDANPPPDGPLKYRLRYKARDGSVSAPSSPVSVATE